MNASLPQAGIDFLCFERPFVGIRHRRRRKPQSRFIKVVSADLLTNGGKETLIEYCGWGSPSKIRPNCERIIFYLSWHFNGYIESNSAGGIWRVSHLLVHLLFD